MPIRLDSRSADFAARFAALSRHQARGRPTDVEQAVRAIIADVRRDGDQALIELSRKFDRIDLDKVGLRVSAAEIDAATAACDPRALDALKLARDRIEAYHRRQKPEGRPLHRRARRRTRPPLDRDRGRRALRAGRHRGLSVFGADERRAGQGRRRAARRHGGAGAGRQAQSRWCWPRRSSPASTRSIASAARRRWRRWPTAPRRSSRWRRSSAPATPMWRRPSAWCSARSAST